MSLAVVLGAGLLGGLGGVLRYLVDGAVTRRAGAGFPFGTLAANLSGAVLLGVLAGASVQGDAYRIWGVGLIGGYTTFSTWMLESQRLAAGRHGQAAFANVVGSVLLGVLAVWLGRSLA